jgi:hypothetical protein
VLKEPDLLNLGASVQRADLLERNGILELGIEVAQDAQKFVAPWSRLKKHCSTKYDFTCCMFWDTIGYANNFKITSL